MKTITLRIPDDIYEHIKSDMGVRILTNNAYSAADQFVARFIELVDQGVEDFTFKWKRKPKRRT